MWQHLPNVKLMNKLPQLSLQLEAGMWLRVYQSHAPWTNFSLEAMTHRGGAHRGSTLVKAGQRRHTASRSRAGPACAQRWSGHVSSGSLRDKHPLVVSSPSAALGSSWLPCSPDGFQALNGVLLLGDPTHLSPFKDLLKHLEMFHTKEILGNRKPYKLCLACFFNRSMG